MLVLFCIIANFSTEYKAFINSTRSESVFVGLTRGEYRLKDFTENPVVLWFWRSTTDSPEADSLLKKNFAGQNFYLSALLRWEAKEQAGYNNTLQKLDLAVRFDSSAVENLFSLIALQSKYRKFNNLADLINLPILDNIRNQAFFITNIFILLALAVFMTGLVYVVAKTVFYLPVLSHRLDPFKHGPFRNALPFVVLLIPALVLRHLFLIYVLYGLILALIMSKREKNWLRFSAILLIGLFVLSFTVDHFRTFLLGGGKAYRLYRMVYFDSDIRVNPETPREKELFAFALKRQGALEDAMSVYEELYYQGNRDASVINNLANIYTAIDEDAKADTLYHYALTQGRPEPYFNLGLLKLKNIEYLESSKYMEEARQLGFSSLSKKPIDIGPTNRDFYTILLDERTKSPPWLNPLMIVPFIIILLVSFLPFQFEPPFYCPLCGQPICSGCRKEKDGEPICGDCFNKLTATKNSDVEDDIRDSLGRHRGVFRRLIGYLINLAAPGSGLIHRGRNFAGLAIIFITMVVWLPALFAHLFVKPAGWIALPLGPALVGPAVAVTVVAYVVSFLLMGEEHAA
jgi:hypothetical protein